MAKVTLDPVSNLQNEQSALETLNTNSVKISVAMENTLSRDGTSPNEMNSDLDMNNHRIYNLPEPVNGTEPFRRADADEILALADEFQAAIEATQGAVDAYESMQALYLGEKTFFPTTDNIGNPLQNGALVSIVDQPNPDDDGMYVYHDGFWNPIGTLPAAFERVEHLLAAGGETSITTLNGYSPSTTKIYRNGVLLRSGTNLGVGDSFDDVTATDGLHLVFPAGVLVANDLISVLSSKPYSIVDPALASDIAFTPTGTISATTVQAAIAETSNEAAQKSTTITGGGLVTGGGDLSASRVLTVTKSNNAQAIAGIDDTTAMTPVRVKEAIVAAGVSPGMVLISSGNAAGLAQLDIPLTGGYRQFMLIGDSWAPALAGFKLLARFSYDNGATYEAGASSYVETGTYTKSSTSTFGSWSSTGNSFIIGPDQVISSSGVGAQFSMFVSTKTTSMPRLSWHMSGTEAGPIVFDINAGGRCAVTTSTVTHIRLVYFSGNIGTGFWSLYGMGA